MYGISPDDIESHKRFAAKNSLNFPLIADPERQLIEQMGLWAERERDGKKFMGVLRTTFLVGPDGNIEHLWNVGQVQGHAAEVLSYCAGVIT